MPLAMDLEIEHSEIMMTKSSSLCRREYLDYAEIKLFPITSSYLPVAKYKVEKIFLFLETGLLKMKEKNYYLSRIFLLLFLFLIFIFPQRSLAAWHKCRSMNTSPSNSFYKSDDTFQRRKLSS